MSAQHLARLGSRPARRLQATRRSLSSSSAHSHSNLAWHERRNPQGKAFFEHAVTGAKQWERPAEGFVEFVAPAKKTAQLAAAGLPMTVSERAYDVLVNSTTAYYAVFAACCGLLVYYYANPTLKKDEVEDVVHQGGVGPRKSS